VDRGEHRLDAAERRNPRLQAQPPANALRCAALKPYRRKE
jgi:hypothetical protein